MDFRRARRGAYLEVRATKNRKPLRVPLSGWVLEIIERNVRECRVDSDRVFAGPGRIGRDGIRRPPTRRQSARQSIERHFPAAVRAAGLRWGRSSPDGVTFHTLRHTMASTALQLGIHERQIMALGNWLDPRMVRTYAHLADEAMRRAAEKVARGLRSANGSASGKRGTAPADKAERRKSARAKKA